MPKAGDVIENPITTDRIIFRKTRRDINGELLQFDNYHKPGGIGPNPHFHPLQEEAFEVVEGTFGITRNGQEQFLNSGEATIVPKGTVHYWRNAGRDELHIITEFRPALHFQEIIETVAALARAGKSDKAGNPDILQMAATLSYYPGELYLDGNPAVVVQRLLARTLGPALRRFFGYPVCYPCKQ
jgi:mannose-6-phosphate isomerase-like protein (cupin superfamily)